MKKSGQTWFYRVYRRIRYLRYVKKVRKERRKQIRLEASLEGDQFRQNLSRQRKLEKQLARQKKKALKRERRKERLAHRAALREKIKQEKLQEKRKKQLEKEELRQKKKEARQALVKLSSEEKALEKQKVKESKAEKRAEQAAIRQRLKEKARQEKALLLEKKQKQRLAKKERRKRIRKLRPYLLKRRLKAAKRTLRSINRESVSRAVRWLVEMIENKQERKLFVAVTVNSIALFVLSYLALYVIGELITLYAAQSFEYNTILFYYKIYFNIDSDQWTPDAVKILFSIKPLTGVVMGTVAMIIFSTLRNDNHVFKLFFLWLFVHGMVMFFGSLLMGTLLNQGFGWVIAYLYYKDTGKMVFSIIAIFALLVTGSAIGRSFLISGNAYFNNVTGNNRKFLLISQVILPFVIGTVIISLMKVPVDFYYTTTEEMMFEIFKLSSILLIMIPVSISFYSAGTIFFDEEERKIRVQWISFLLSLLVFFGYRYLLMNGLVIQV